MSETFEKRKGHCPTCGPDRFADVVAIHTVKNEFDGMWTVDNYRILRCRGCEDIYYQHASMFSEHMEHSHNKYTGEEEMIFPEEVKHWPAPSKRQPPEWLHRLIANHPIVGRLLEDVYAALDADLVVPAAIATRTTFDAASENLGIEPSLRFRDKLDQLQKNGLVGDNERATLAVLVDAGSAAAHRGWRPSVRELDSIVSILEAFIFRSLVLKDEAATLSASIPAKHPRGS